MNFKVDVQEFKLAVINATRFAAAKSTIKALEKVHCHIKDGLLTVTGYDLTMGYQTSLAIETMDGDEISFLIDSKLVASYLSKLKTTDVEVETDGFKIVFVSRKAKLEMMTETANDYPSIASEEDTIGTIKIDTELLKSLISSTIYCVSSSDTRPILRGELIKAENDSLAIVALDGFRVAVRNEPIKTDDVSAVIPSSFLAEAVKILSDDETELKFKKRMISVKFGTTTMFTRLLEGEYPDHVRVMPTKFVTEAVVDRKELIDCLERAALLVNDRIKSPIRITVGNGKMSMNVKTSIGSMNDEIDVDSSGESIEIGFNCKYMLEAMKAIDEDKVLMNFAGAVKPLLITDAKKTNRYQTLVLPVRLS